jgi:hypothetical protein
VIPNQEAVLPHFVNVSPEEQKSGESRERQSNFFNDDLMSFFHGLHMGRTKLSSPASRLSPN